GNRPPKWPQERRSAFRILDRGATRAETRSRRREEIPLQGQNGSHFVSQASSFRSLSLRVAALLCSRPYHDDQPSVHAMPLSISSFIAFPFLERCANPMPRRTFGALVNWMLS